MYSTGYKLLDSDSRDRSCSALWSAIEDATIDQPMSLLWLNFFYVERRGGAGSLIRTKPAQARTAFWTAREQRLATAPAIFLWPYSDQREQLPSLQ